MTLSAQLIEHYEQEQNLKLTKTQKKQKRRLHKNRPFPHSQKFPNVTRYQSLFERIASDQFHENLLAGKPGTFDDLIMFLRDDAGGYKTIGLKNHYLKFLKNHPLTESQANAVRQLIWDYIHSTLNHRSKLFCRLAIKVSTPKFHLAVSSAANSANGLFGWKIELLHHYLDHHCPETKPTLNS